MIKIKVDGKYNNFFRFKNNNNIIEIFISIVFIKKKIDKKINNLFKINKNNKI